MGFRKCLKIWKWLYRGERFLGGSLTRDTRVGLAAWLAYALKAYALKAYALKAQGLRAQGSRLTRSRLQAQGLRAQGSRLKAYALKAYALKAPGSRLTRSIIRCIIRYKLQRALLRRFCFNFDSRYHLK